VCSSVVCILGTIGSFTILCSWYYFLKRLASIGKMTSSDGPQPYPRDVAYELPTPGQQEAVRLLDGQDVDDVFAYLKYARSSAGSSRRGEGSRGHGEGLLPEQVGAIKTLSGCADRKLRTWLRDARATSTSPLFPLPHLMSLTASRRRYWSHRYLPEQLYFSVALPSDAPYLGCACTVERLQTFFGGPLPSPTVCQTHRETPSLSLHNLRRTSIL